MPGRCKARPIHCSTCVDAAGNDAHDEMFLRAHAGHDGVGGMEHFQHRADAFLAVRPHGADFGQGGGGVSPQRRAPNHPLHVLQTGGEAAEGLAGQPVADHARPPLGPRHLGDVRGIETVAGWRDRPRGGPPHRRTAVENLRREFRGVGLGGAGRATGRKPPFSSVRCPAWPTVRQTACSAGPAAYAPGTPTAGGGRSASPKRPAACPSGRRRSPPEEYLSQALEAADDLKLFDRHGPVESHHVLLRLWPHAARPCGADIPSGGKCLP